MADLPQIICGPILRSVEPDAMILWLVTSHDRPADVQLTVDIERCDEQLVRVGRYAWIRRLYITPKTPLSDQQYIEYDVLFDGQGIKHTSPHLLYADQHSPGFVFKSHIDKLLHGSCRRPHHTATDGLIRVDQQLEACVNSPADRPALLLHSGDQVYVDDVAGPMLVAIKQVIEQLGLYDEHFDGAPFNSLQELYQSDKHYYARDSLLPDTESNEAITEKFFGGVRKPIFTSSNAANHLISLSEVIAMYLLCWSPHPWRWVNIETPTSLSEQNKQRFNTELQALNAFSANLPKAARALANIPNYMIFDDHDVTDDWNLSALWEETAYEHPFSKRIVGNALIGYLLCQSWGNHRDQFQPLINHLQEGTPSDSSWPQSMQDELIDKLLYFEHWGYDVTSQPAIIVLDTRTQRWRSERARSKPSGLMDWEALTAFQHKLIDKPSVIVVSPAPMFGVKLIEAIQDVFTFFGKPLLVDAENWMAHQGAAEVMLNIFAHRKTPEHFTILSGDVHYSFAYDVHLKHRKRSPRIYQITSSGIKNEFPDKLLEWLDRLNRWLFAPYSPLNWFTKRRRFRVTPRLPSERDAGERLWNQSGIGYVEFNKEGIPQLIQQLGASRGKCTFNPSKVNKESTE